MSKNQFTHAPSDNPTAIVGFESAAVLKHGSQEAFVKYGKAQGYWEGRDDQETLLQDAWKLAGGEQPAPAKAEGGKK